MDIKRNFLKPPKTKRPNFVVQLQAAHKVLDQSKDTRKDCSRKDS